MNFSQGHSGTKVRNVNRACFPKENKHEFTKKWAKFMNFSFWPCLWFGLPGRLLTNCLLKCLPICLSPQFFLLSKLPPRGKNCLPAIFASRHQALSLQTLWAISPEKARFSRKDFCPIFSENLRLKPPFVSPPLRFSQQRLGPRFYIFR